MTGSAASPRFSLRAATAQAHERLDRLYSQLDLGDPNDYARFLTSHAAAFIPVEDALDAAGAEALGAGWRASRRSDALRADLGALGLPIPALENPPTFKTEAQILGGLYVLEGSRLGGAVLIRSVAPGQPTGFLTPGNPNAWRAFIAVLDERLSSAERLGDAATSASAVFDLFERAARTRLEHDNLAD